MNKYNTPFLEHERPEMDDLKEIKLYTVESYENLDRKMLIKKKSNVAFRGIIILLLVCQVN